MGEQALPYAVGRRRQVVLEVLRLITKLDMRSVETRCIRFAISPSSACDQPTATKATITI